MSTPRLDQALYTYLRSCTDLAGFIGNRLYRRYADRGVARPYCVLLRVYRGRHYSHGGFSGLTEYIVQVSCYADSDEDAERVAEHVIAAMEAWPEANPGVQSVELEDDTQVNDPGLAQDLPYVCHTALDFRIVYSE